MAGHCHHNYHNQITSKATRTLISNNEEGDPSSSEDIANIMEEIGKGLRQRLQRMVSLRTATSEFK